MKATRNSHETKLRLVNISKATDIGTLVAQYSHAGKVKWFPTGQKVTAKYWNEGKGEILKGWAESQEVTAANAHLKTVKGTLDKLILTHLQAHAEKPTLTQLETAYNSLNTPEAVEATVTPVIDALAAYMEVKKLEIEDNSLKSYSALSQNLKSYKETGQDWELETLTLSQIEAFQEWLINSKGFHNTTVERRVIALKKFLEAHANSLQFNYKELRCKYKVKAAKNLILVTLTPSELKAMESMNLTSKPRLERVRDLFLLQTWTGLRFSDVIRLSKEHIVKNTVVVDINKTDDYSSTPLFPTAKSILEKYSYQPIKVTNQEYNRVLKDVTKLLAETQESLNTIISQFHIVGTKKIVKKAPKHELITTHTARRTFVTICIEKGISQHFVMKWSNHSDPRSFRKYQNSLQGESDAVQQLINALS